MKKVFKIIIIRLIAIFCLILLQQAVMAQFRPDSYTQLPTTHNFVRNYTVIKPGLTPAQVVDATAIPNAVQLSTEYYDGLGRPIQTVVRKGSLNTAISGATPTDLVIPKYYDAYGREAHQFLPYVSLETNGNLKGSISPVVNPFQQQKDFYLNTNASINPIANQGETYFYSQSIFEASPLNRVTESFEPGNSWVGTSGQTLETDRKSVKIKHWINTDIDAVRIWNVTNHATLGNWGTYNSTDIYPTGQLHKTVTVDEHGKQVIEFKDKSGQVTLKKVQLTGAADNGTGMDHDGWICTYYLYDDFGNLRCVTQPEGVKWLSTPANNWNLANTTILDEQCFRYEYDGRQRMILKKVPGAATVYMVYDKRDRLVLTQDGNMRVAPARWHYTWYDNLNRPVATGIYTTNTSFATLRTNAASLPAATYQFYPALGTSGLAEQTRIFFDDYSFTSDPVYASNGFVKNPGAGIFGNFNNYENDDNVNFPYPRKMVCAQNVKGLVTGIKTKVLNTNNWIYSLIHYDDNGRQLVVQQYNKELNAIDLNVTRYGFAGQPYYTLHRQDIGLSTGNEKFLVTRTETKFDELGRPAEVLKAIAQSNVNNGSFSPPMVFVNTQYDALGNLKKKHLGQKNGTTEGPPLESITYDYNIRGWLLGVNRAFLNPSVAQNPSDGKWFGFELGYDKGDNTAESPQYTNAQYNGNIRGQIWRSAGDGIRRNNHYTYDAANRLLAAHYTQKNGNGHWDNSEMSFSFWTDPSGGDSPTVGYDLNGNLLRMGHRGFVPEASSVWDTNLDVMEYEYFPNTNRLKRVLDHMGSSKGQGDFSDVHTGDTDYAYDANGNLLRDLNKRIGTTSANGITYNELNLPLVVTVFKPDGTTKGTITYTYDATGTKLRKTTVETGLTIGATTNITLTTTTTYLSGSVYESKTYSTVPAGLANYTMQLQFFGQQEGRVRALRISPQSNPTGFAYDYFLKDHLGNVRMVLTDEQKINLYPSTTVEGTAGGSTNSLVNAESAFYKIDATKIVAEASIPSWGTETGTTKDYFNHNGNPPANNAYPAGATPLATAKSSNLYKLNATTNKTGLEFMIKVMAGDTIDIFGKSYYHNTTNITDANSSTLNWAGLLTSLLTSPLNAIAGKGITGTQLNSFNAGLLPANFIRGSNSEPTTQVPKAYINYIFFDEQFKYAGGNFSRVGTSGTVNNHWQADESLQNIKAPKNGYVFVYVSNESNFDVFFDNLQVIHKPGPLLEETHYYPFGLTMAGISSKAANRLENKDKFNDGTELNTDLGLDWYETTFRGYDAQIGRFHQLDPLGELFENESLYVFAGNNPINYNDPLGLAKTTTDTTSTLPPVEIVAPKKYPSQI